MIIILKQVVVGKYKEGILNIPTTIAHLRWWFVDKVVEVWEHCVGRFILGTPLVNLFYYRMGAKVHKSTPFDSFIREFDLVTIGKDTSIAHHVNCRKFGARDNDLKPTLRFRTVVIKN